VADFGIFDSTMLKGFLVFKVDKKILVFCIINAATLTRLSLFGGLFNLSFIVIHTSH